MSSNAKHYDYYMVEGDDVKKVIDAYDDIQKRRNEILGDAMRKVGAIAFTTTRSWGAVGGGLLESFVWSKQFEFPCQVTIKREDFWDGQRVIVARGKGNTKDGREYNKKLDVVMREANEQLKLLPEWKDYIVNHYGIARTGIGEQSGRGFGFAMLSTYGGKHPQKDNCLIFAVPNTKDAGHGQVTIPDNFKQITYGQFYDIANSGGEE